MLPAMMGKKGALGFAAGGIPGMLLAKGKGKAGGPSITRGGDRPRPTFGSGDNGDGSMS